MFTLKCFANSLAHLQSSVLKSVILLQNKKHAPLQLIWLLWQFFPATYSHNNFINTKQQTYCKHIAVYSVWTMLAELIFKQVSINFIYCVSECAHYRCIYIHVVCMHDIYQCTKFSRGWFPSKTQYWVYTAKCFMFTVNCQYRMWSSSCDWIMYSILLYYSKIVFVPIEMNSPYGWWCNDQNQGRARLQLTRLDQFFPLW